MRSERNDKPALHVASRSDQLGNVLEIVVLELDDGRRLVFDAMRMRSSNMDLLPGSW